MSLFGISDTQLEQMVYPNGRGGYSFGSKPVALPAATATPVVSAPVATTPTTAAAVPGTAIAAAPAAGGAAGAAGGMGGYGSIASGAISQIAQVASDWTAAKAKAEALKSQSAIPNIPESAGALAGFNAPAIKIG